MSQIRAGEATAACRTFAWLAEWTLQQGLRRLCASFPFRQNRPHPMPASFAALFLAALLGAAVAGVLPVLLVALYLAASIATFIVYAVDKTAARNNQWRIRESTLHALGLAGGWPGALIAQAALRHKSRKLPFRVVLWATVAVHCGAIAAYFYRYPFALANVI